MRHDALRRAIGAGVVIAAAALLFGNHAVGLTGAVFNAETTNANSVYAGGWIGKPSSATATASGTDVNLGWTPGTDGPVTGQTIKGTYNGTSSNCSGAAYTDFSFNMPAANTPSATDATRAVSHNGEWACYEIVSTSATVWTAAYVLPALQLGLAATNVSISNAGGNSGTIESGDTITITFNQKTNIPANSVKVCVFGSPDNTILIGDQKNGSNCGSVGSDGYSIGKLTSTSSLGSPRFSNSAVSVSGSAPWTVTITLGSGGTGAAPSGTWTFTPAATVSTNAPADNTTACTSGSSCQPTTSSNF